MEIPRVSGQWMCIKLQGLSMSTTKYLCILSLDEGLGVYPPAKNPAPHNMDHTYCASSLFKSWVTCILYFLCAAADRSDAVLAFRPGLGVLCHSSLCWWRCQ
eukprot:scaffold17233_cov19-Tisochrysis_lutea.AAC.1